MGQQSPRTTVEKLERRTCLGKYLLVFCDLSWTYMLKQAVFDTPITLRTTTSLGTCDSSLGEYMLVFL